MYLTYETIVLIFLLGLLVGVCLRPARAGLRSVQRAHRAAQRASRPAAPRRRRRRAKNVSTS